jgi:DNA-binding NtrC family response regulator
MKTILIVDDEPAARYGMRRALESAYRVVEADSAAAARSLLFSDKPDLLLLDVVLPGEDGITFLKWLRAEGHELPVLMVSALDTAKTAVDALQLGAADYLVKGFELEEIRQRVASLLKLAALTQENESLRRRLASEGQFGQMIGRSAAMRRAFELADRVAPADSSVLLLGERKFTLVPRGTENHLSL